MAKKSRSASKKGRSNKWSAANIMNYILGGIVALSMVLGSIFVFGGASPNTQPPTVTPTPIVTIAPASAQGATVPPTPTP